MNGRLSDAVTLKGRTLRWFRIRSLSCCGGDVRKDVLAHATDCRWYRGEWVW